MVISVMDVVSTAIFDTGIMLSFLLLHAGGALFPLALLILRPGPLASLFAR